MTAGGKARGRLFTVQDWHMRLINVLSANMKLHDKQICGI